MLSKHGVEAVSNEGEAWSMSWFKFGHRPFFFILVRFEWVNRVEIKWVYPYIPIWPGPNTKSFNGAPWETLCQRLGKLFSVYNHWMYLIWETNQMIPDSLEGIGQKSKDTPCQQHSARIAQISSPDLTAPVLIFLDTIQSLFTAWLQCIQLRAIPLVKLKEAQPSSNNSKLIKMFCLQRWCCII